MANAGCPLCNREGTSRRNVILGLGGAAASAALSSHHADATDRRSKKGLIDVHHHIVPPAFLASLSTRIPYLESWSVPAAIAMLDEYGIQTGITSINAPGIDQINRSAARSLARSCNEFAARMMTDHPTRFGMFASLPAMDVDGSLSEMTYASDVLKADGMGLMTSYNGTYLADPHFLPLLEEMNRRGTVLFVHPAIPLGVPNQNFADRVALEMPFDTARALLGLLRAGLLQRFPRIRYIFAHGGGALPTLYQRIDFLFAQDPKLSALYPGGMLEALRNVYFDIVGVAGRRTFPFIRSLYRPDQLLFGTDNPAVPGAVTSSLFQDLDVSPALRGAIGRDNAVGLFPRFS